MGEYLEEAGLCKSDGYVHDGVASQLDFGTHL